MSITAEVARFVADLEFETLPRDIQERARTSLLNRRADRIRGISLST